MRRRPTALLAAFLAVGITAYEPAPAEEGPRASRPGAEDGAERERPRRGRRTRRPGVLFRVLDADGDGDISPDEIANAPAALTELDRDGDGEITSREIRERRREARPGRRRPRRDRDDEEGEPQDEFVERALELDANGDGALGKQELARLGEALEDEHREESADEDDGDDDGDDVEDWVARFERDEREVYAAREEIADALPLEQGARVADVGAGTGFFSQLLAERVGPQGWVYAVDVSERSIGYIAQRMAQAELGHVTPVLSSENSVRLPPASVDLMFSMNAYHHFDEPPVILGSMHRAIRPGGTLAVVDFERIPGESRDWIIEHVRADKEMVRAEAEEAGFRFVREAEIEGLEENYLLIFRRR